MSSSSPEVRPFLAKPSPLRSEAQVTAPEAADWRMKLSEPQNIEVVTHAQPRPPSVNVDAGTRASTTSAVPTHRGGTPHAPEVPRRSDSQRRRTTTPRPYHNRERSRSRSQVGRSGPSSSIGNPKSIANFRPAGIDDLINIPNLRSTFNPGGFTSSEDDRMFRGPQQAAEHLLDRSPTPPYEQNTVRRSSLGHRTPARGSSHHRGGEGLTRKSTRSKRSIEEALGVEVNDPSQAIAKTFVRPEPPNDLLEYPVIFNPRVTMMVSITQPLYIGGGSVDGRLNIHIRGTRLDDIRLGRVSVDIAGIEELSFSRKTMFMNIASELIDEDHPPPAAMLATAEEETKMFWKVKPSRSFLPFKLSLPLNVGPGPFNSVRARIRYVIHGTILISINGNKSVVRTCRDIRIISALDPTTTLLPLERPLLSTEEHSLRYGGHKTLKVTAGLHRAVWVAGTAAYVDVNIINNTSRKVKSVKCKLRRHILAYKNTVALAENQSAGHLRVPNWIERKTLSHSELNIGSRWRGVKGSQLDVVTCEIEIPRNQASVKMGRYFEVKYLIDIGVCTPAARTVRVQLPITIVHMNSLDIMPNDLEEVTKSIATRYGREKAQQYLVGKAFTAPREYTANKALPPALLPTLQPRRSSMKRSESQEPHPRRKHSLREDGRSERERGRYRSRDHHDDAYDTKEGRRSGSISRASRRRSKSSVSFRQIPNRSTREMLEELGGLRQ
ncbi:Similar to Uncharacterized protein C557.05; acc. no. Q9USS1 [Pyronema omphalodes CBS 100304]|uniref:Similar to Uncharacterized protein C557.05 acc. no. Q9USS1 n=1 Tax=Pyronema omphalodes (strain CBS 100304) TaxID=1076935 RepID=U4KV50_PYROM|nr:Similar to Uncharacterized protein C557.05; acc. no. Q9USS1 [Pyronema omphalodes CBS 100304]